MKEGEGKGVAAPRVDGRTSPASSDAGAVGGTSDAYAAHGAADASDADDAAVATTAPLPTPADVTRTSNEPVGTPSEPSTSEPQDEPRLAAPLQTRDPGRYKIIGEHGRGGIGRVLRAHDKELGRDIAVKELLERGSVSEVRFLREALITARLEHPGIVPVHEAGRWPDGTPFYAMKLVSGNSLKVMIEKATTVEQRLALIPHVIAVADAIAYAHDRKIIHRDLKPSNVIVGEFGETVVIDWGLAKSLDDATGIADSPYRGAQSDEITISGSVLGTPAYMAPEQLRGFSDERTDVYAVGGILHHLLIGRPPGDPAISEHAAPTAFDVPRDLRAVLAAALSPVASSRYQTARALADDLRRYTLHQRVHARRYSLVDQAVRFMGRHRAATASASLGLLLATGVLGISLIVISDQKTAIENTQETLLLDHAESLVRVDPTSAIELLKQSRVETDKRSRIEAEAFGRGVAIESSAIHSDGLLFLEPLSDGSVVSMAEDQRVVVTHQRADATTRHVLSKQATYPIVVNRARDRLLFQNMRSNVSLVDSATGITEEVSSAHALALALSNDGSEIVAQTNDGRVLRMRRAAKWQPEWVGTTQNLRGLEFTSNNNVLMVESDKLRMIAGIHTETLVPLSIATYVMSERQVAVGTQDGRIVILDSNSLTKTIEFKACSGAISAVALPAKSEAVAYLCAGGSIGIRNTGDGKILDEFRTAPVATTLVASADGTLLLSMTGTGTALAYSLHQRLVHSLTGHPSNITALAGPTDSYPFITTGDTNGQIRTWPLPRADERLIARVGSGVYGAVLSPDGRLLATDGDSGIVRTVDMATGLISNLKGHNAEVFGVAFSPAGKTLVSCSFDGTIRAWKPDTGELIRSFSAHGAHVSGALFADEDHVISVGEDGRVLEWSLGDGQFRIIFSENQPLKWLKRLEATGELITVDSDMNIWSLAGAHSHIVYTHDNQITFLKISPNQRVAIVGDAGGAVVLLDTTSWRTIKRYQLDGAIRYVGIDPNNEEITVAVKNGHVLRFSLASDRPVQWEDLPLTARSVVYAQDANHLAIVTQHEGIWVYSIRDATWTFWQTHDPETRSGLFTSDGANFITLDASGQIIAHAMH